MKVFEHKSIGVQLFKLSVPATVAMLGNALYNLIDAVFIGRYVGSLALASLGITFPITMIIGAAGICLGLGLASIFSRALGANDTRRAYQAAGNMFTSSLSIGFILSPLVFIFAGDLLKAFGATRAIMPYAHEYLNVILISTLFVPFYLSANNLIRAEGKAKTAMLAMLCGFIANILLDYLFIVVLKYGIAGAAWATVIGRLLTVAVVLWHFSSRHTVVRFSLSIFRLRKDIMLEAAAIGTSSLVMHITGAMMALALNNMLGYYGGNTAIAVYSIGFRLIIFIHMPIFGINQALRPIVGYHYGAEAYAKVLHAMRLGFIWALSVAVCWLMLIEFKPDWFLSLFTTDNDLLEAGTFAIRMLLLGLPMVIIQMLATGYFQAVGKAREALFLSLLRRLILFLPLLAVLPGLCGLGLNGIWYCFPIADISGGLITGFILFRSLRKLNDTT